MCYNADKNNYRNTENSRKVNIAEIKFPERKKKLPTMFIPEI